MERLSYSVLEQKYLRVVEAYQNLKARHEKLKNRAESFKDDARSEKIRRQEIEREFRGYLSAGQNSLKSYREIIKLASGRLRGQNEEEFADRLDNYLINMQERVQPVADMKKLVDALEECLDELIDNHGKAEAFREERQILIEAKGYDPWEDVSPLPVEADGGEGRD